jgi:hypothetical protein
VSRRIPLVLSLTFACTDGREEATTATASGLTGIGSLGDDAGTGGSDGADAEAGEEDTGQAFDVGAGEGGSADGGEGGDCPCANVLDGIYVLNALEPPSVWFYAPLDNEFTQVGTLGCPAPAGATANSMAIDRQGNAWLNYYAQSSIGGPWEGWLYRAPLSDLSACEPLDYHAQSAWYLMGMGYAVHGEGSSCDTLFLHNSDDYVLYPNVSGGSELARWDEAVEQRVSIGPTGYPVAELTGTGDGRLFGFATVAQNESVLVRFDKGSGSEIESIPLDGLDITLAFAFAFWGGDVYFFTEVQTGGMNSKVTRLDYDGNDGGGLTVVNPSSGLRITGAGVSTCASFTPPG